MTRHTVSKTNPIYVTGADSYRLTFTDVFTPTHQLFEAMSEYLKPEHRNTTGYGVAFLESEEHSVTYIGQVLQIEEYRAITDGTAVLDTSQGVMYGFWPNGRQWDGYFPEIPWNQGGEGIVTDFDHPRGGRVTVYEYFHEGADGQREAMVGWHCEHCHPEPRIDHDAGKLNTGPHARRWMGRNARAHIRSHVERCQPINPQIAEVATVVSNRMLGADNPVVSAESYCATTGPCALIRHMRARA